MKPSQNTIKPKLQILLLFVFLYLMVACEEFVEIGPPVNEIVSETAFGSDEAATSTIIGLYGEMTAPGSGGSPFNGTLEVVTGLLSDEFINQSRLGDYLEYEENDMTVENQQVLTVFWVNFYRYIVNANAIIENLTDNDRLTPEVRDQLLGEAYFIRALVHFYMVNLFGDIPYAETTNLEVNSRIVRIPVAEVYVKLIEDLEQAVELLPTGYEFNSGKRNRPNRSAAEALLARVYLYNQDWANTELYATNVIESGFFRLENLDQVFLEDSGEAIFQLSAISLFRRTGTTFLGDMTILNNPPSGFASPIGATSVRNGLFEGFDPGDQRLVDWVSTLVSGTNSWDYPHKYKNALFSAPNPPEAYMIFRLAEQYLIRAEARAQLGNLNGAQADINMIRNRAGLPNTEASSQTEILETIARERRIELLSEGGHRWLDLKRTNTADQVLELLKSDWDPTDVLFPIPEDEILRNPNLTQNPGY